MPAAYVAKNFSFYGWKGRPGLKIAASNYFSFQFFGTTELADWIVLPRTNEIIR